VTAVDPAKARPLLELAVQYHRDALGDDDDRTHNSLIALGGSLRAGRLVFRPFLFHCPCCSHPRVWQA
jgi:hypothetical protein